MSDSSAIEAALVDWLAGDAALAALMQSGAFVFMDEASPGATRFVIVSLVDEVDVPIFEGRGREDAVYLVEARMLSTAGGNIRAAAARIDALLDGAVFAIAGYHLQLVRRVGRTRMTEVDDADASIRWHRRGGHYQVLAAPLE